MSKDKFPNWYYSSIIICILNVYTTPEFLFIRHLWTDRSAFSRALPITSMIDRSVDRHKTQLIGLICPRPESIQLVSGIHATTPPPFPDHYLPSVAERLWPCFSHIKCHGQKKKRPCGNANYHHYHLYIMHISCM